MNDIQKKMISLVDKEKFKKCLAIVTRQKDAYTKVDDSVVNWYLEQWAKKKEKLFVLIGEKLTYSKSFSFKRDEQSTIQEFEDMCKRLPNYCRFVFEKFNIKEFEENSIIYNFRYFSKLGIPIKEGEKLSKVLSKIFDDEKIDIEISKFFQNMNVNGYFSISIDPVEFMTMSITKNKWNSCYNIQNGCFSNCPLGLILDECSMVCYRHNGNKFIYEFENIGSNVTFEHNSKQIRNVISVNPDSKFVVVYHPCVCVDTSYYKMLESTFFEFTKEKGFVKNFISDSYSNCIRIRQKGVTHIKDDFKYCFSCNSELTDEDFVILSSKSVKNPINGKEVSKNSEM